MKVDRVVIASQNPDKVAEIEQVLAALDHPVAVVRDLSWPEPEEPEPTLEGNAIHKARAVVAATGHAALADDTGLEVAALDDDPGVRTARYSGPDATYADNREKLLHTMEGVADRRARFRTVIALVSADGETITAEGAIDGVITAAERGSGGFGYDPIFEVDGMTFAEMSERDKNAMSHRARALRALVEKLDGSGG